MRKPSLRPRGSRVICPAYDCPRGCPEHCPNFGFTRHVQGQRVIVSNTHLFWRPDFDCLRVLQAHRLRRRLEELKSNDVTNERAIIVMCGIGIPIRKAQFIIWSRGKSINYPGALAGINQRAFRAVSTSLESSQRLFAQVLRISRNGLPSRQLTPFTDPRWSIVCSWAPYTLINAYVDTLDYIFTDFRAVEVAELLMLPADEIVRGQTALPNEIYSPIIWLWWPNFISKLTESISNCFNIYCNIKINHPSMIDKLIFSWKAYEPKNMFKIGNFFI